MIAAAQRVIEKTKEYLMSEQIEELAKIVESRRLAYEMLGMRNTAGMDEIERRLSHLHYQEAWHSLRDAERMLDEALKAKQESDSLILRLRESAA